MGNHRYWDGKAVKVCQRSNAYDLRNVEVGLSRNTAGALANLLRLHNTPGSSMMPDGLHELMVALDYVLVSDPASVAAYRRMEASKGMDPSMSNPPPVVRPLRETDGP